MCSPEHPSNVIFNRIGARKENELAELKLKSTSEQISVSLTNHSDTNLIDFESRNALVFEINIDPVKFDFDINFDSFFEISNTDSNSTTDFKENQTNSQPELTNETNSQKFRVERRSNLDKDVILNSLFCDRSEIETLWEEKSKLDKWFDSNQGKLYKQARQQVFPFRHSQNPLCLNRCEIKLHQIAGETKLIDRLMENEPCYVLDILGYQKVWGEFLFNSIQKRYKRQDLCTLQVFNVGVIPKRTKEIGTIDSNENEKVLSFLRYYEPFNYTKIESSGEFTVLAEVPAISNAVDFNIIEKVVTYFNNRDMLISLVVADGSIKIGINPETGIHLKNYQETFNSRCVLSQVILGLQVLKEKGDFVLKLFDMFTSLTASLVFFLRCIFNKVVVIKPVYSRPVNSERYVVCTHYKRDIELLRPLIKFYIDWSASIYCNDSLPHSLCSESILKNNSSFYQSYRLMSSALCLRQCAALDKVYKQLQILQKEYKDILNNTKKEHSNPQHNITNKKNNRSKIKRNVYKNDYQSMRESKENVSNKKNLFSEKLSSNVSSSSLKNFSKEYKNNTKATDIDCTSNFKPLLLVHYEAFLPNNQKYNQKYRNKTRRQHEEQYCSENEQTNFQQLTNKSAQNELLKKLFQNIGVTNVFFETECKEISSAHLRHQHNHTTSNESYTEYPLKSFSRQLEFQNDNPQNLYSKEKETNSCNNSCYREKNDIFNVEHPLETNKKKKLYTKAEILFYRYHLYKQNQRQSKTS